MIKLSIVIDTRGPAAVTTADSEFESPTHIELLELRRQMDLKFEKWTPVLDQFAASILKHHGIPHAPGEKR